LSGKTVLPFGTWPSAIRPETIGLGKRLDDVQWGAGGNCLLWLEGRSGKGVIVCREEGDAPRDLNEIQSVRAGAGYGGGDFCAARDFAVFAEKNGRLYRVAFGNGDPFPVTPEYGHAAAPAVSPDGRWILYVHSYEKKDRLALVDAEGRLWPRILVEGADFYMQPVWHPSGDRIAWVEWNHPCMPWDGTRLKTARITGDAAGLAEEKTLIGDEECPASQPAFSPDGRQLACIAGEGEWENLLLFDLQTGKKKVLVEGGTLSDPAWTQGNRAIGWSADSRKVFFRRNEGGFASLWMVNAAGGAAEKLGIEPYTWINQITPSPASDTVAFIGSSPSIPPRILVREKGGVRVQARSSAERIDTGDLSAPVPMTWQAAEGGTVHGLYYPPFHPRYEGRGLPPAVISIHGGPTGQRTAAYNPEAAFFTSRGYAFLAVNYRGSTGYGRRYMLALRGRWGELDVDDAVSGAKALCDRSLADPARLVILGGSAGGYTVLNALVRNPGFFRAGVCLFGVSDLFRLALETHKFEEKYLDSMVGPLPESAEKYRAWSPIFHADAIRDPLAVFQGSEDTVVPPNQSERIVEALQKRKIPCLYRLFPGEGHGWRQTETIVAYYSEMEKFLQQYVLYT
jgi:dipeptidyl aminopeptidase/acylaminoacyl peptidase